jgi:hypothetical protein
MTNYIQVPVPEEQVPRVYALLANLDSEATGPEGAGADEPFIPAPALSEALVVRMFKDSEQRHRRLLLFLAENAGTWFYTGELAEELEVPTGRKGMAGVFGAFGRRSKHRYGGATPWELDWEPEEKEEVRYMMRPEVAAWIKGAAAS